MLVLAAAGTTGTTAPNTWIDSLTSELFQSKTPPSSDTPPQLGGTQVNLGMEVPAIGSRYGSGSGSTSPHSSTPSVSLSAPVGGPMASEGVQRSQSGAGMMVMPAAASIGPTSAVAAAMAGVSVAAEGSSRSRGGAGDAAVSGPPPPVGGVVGGAGGSGTPSSSSMCSQGSAQLVLHTATADLMRDIMWDDASSVSHGRKLHQERRVTDRGVP